MTRSVLVIGRSHVAAIRDAARIRREADPARPRTRVIHMREPQYAPEIVGEGDSAAFSPALAAAIRDQIDRHAPVVASCIGGQFHNALALLRHPRPFDFRLSGEPAPEPAIGAEPIPEALVRAALADGMAGDLLRLRLLRDLIGPFIQLESPPLVEDDAFIAAHAEAYFAARGHDVAPAPLRWKIWRLASRLMREGAEALGCRYLPVPAAAVDAAGYLAQPFAGDATHGNHRYGEAVIAQLETL